MVAPVIEAAPRHALTDFAGKVVAPGERFRVVSKPVGVSGVNALVSLGKVQWNEYESGSGKVTKEAFATVSVERGTETKRIRLGEKQSKTVLGCVVTLEAAGEEYAEARSKYLAFAELTVVAAK